MTVLILEAPLMVEEQVTVCMFVLVPWLTETSISKGLEGPLTRRVRVPGGLEASVPPSEGETTRTTGDSLDGEGDGAGDTLMPGDVLDTGEDGTCAPDD